MPEKKTDESAGARVYACDYCDFECTTRQGLAKHKKVCEYRPDDEDGEGLPAPGGAGVDLYGSEESGGEPEENLYQCPDCGYSANRAFIQCPNCAADLEW